MVGGTGIRLVDCFMEVASNLERTQGPFIYYIYIYGSKPYEAESLYSL